MLSQLTSEAMIRYCPLCDMHENTHWNMCVDNQSQFMFSITQGNFLVTKIYSKLTNNISTSIKMVKSSCIISLNWRGIGQRLPEFRDIWILYCYFDEMLKTYKKNGLVYL